VKYQITAIAFLVIGGIFLYVTRLYGIFERCRWFGDVYVCPPGIVYFYLAIGIILISIGVILLIIRYKKRKKSQLS